MICPTCGAQIDDDSRFCYACGNKIPQDYVAPKGSGGSIWDNDDDSGFARQIDANSDFGTPARICPYCGCEVDLGQTNCTRCGRYIPKSPDEFPSAEREPPTSVIDNQETPLQNRNAWIDGGQPSDRQWVQGTQPVQPVPQPTGGGNDNDQPQYEVKKKKPDGKRIGIIVGSIVIGLAVIAGLVFVAVPAITQLGKKEPIEEKTEEEKKKEAEEKKKAEEEKKRKEEEEKKKKAEEEKKKKMGQLVGHFTMSDAEFGTNDYKDAIILDRDQKGNSTLLYRENLLTGVIKRDKEEESTYVYKMSDIKDKNGKALSNASVTIEIPKTMTKDNIAGNWRICYRNGKTTISDWAIVNSDGTGVAGFSYQFDIFVQNWDYVRKNASRRAWTKTGDGRYKVTAPDKNGVERMIYIAD